MARATDRPREAVKPLARLDVLLCLASVSDVARDEDAVRGPRWQGRYDRRRVSDKLSLHVVVDVDDVVTLLPEVDVGDVDENYRH